MKITIDAYEDTGNPMICFDELPVTTNYCHLPNNETALNTKEFPEVLDCLIALGICKNTGNLVKCDAGTFPVVTVKKISEEGIEI